MTAEERSVAQFTNLSDFGVREWCQNPETSSFWLRAYTCLLIPHDRFMPALMKPLKLLSFDQPVVPYYVVMGVSEVTRMRDYMYAGSDGMTTVQFESEKQELPQSTYVLLTTPYKIDSESGDWAATNTRLDVAASIIRMHCGANFLRDLVLECEHEYTEGKMSEIGGARRLPQPSEGPFISPTNWDQISEIINKLGQLLPVNKRRIDLSLEFFNRALNGEEPFFNYWTALEILCKGKSQKIRMRLKECYGLDNVGDVDRFTGFGVLSNWRHEFFHKGIRRQLLADVERYIQLLFLDLLRYEIHLPKVGHIAGIQQASGYNLSELGLADTTDQSEPFVVKPRGQTR